MNRDVIPILDRQLRREAEARAAADNAGLDPCEVDATPTEHEQRIAEDLTGFDPECPFVGTNPLHTCTTNTGALTRPGQSCFPGARASMANHPSAARS